MTVWLKYICLSRFGSLSCLPLRSCRQDAASQNAFRRNGDEHTCGGDPRREKLEAAPESAAWLTSTVSAKAPSFWRALGGYNIGALIIRIGFWGPLYYNYGKEPPKIVLVII